MKVNQGHITPLQLCKMYNLRSRGRVTSAGSARPHLGMGLVPSRLSLAMQVTPSQAVAMLEYEIIPETEVFGHDDVISDTFGGIYATDVEATQPPILTPIAPQDLILWSVRWRRPQLRSGSGRVENVRYRLLGLALTTTTTTDYLVATRYFLVATT